jgi:hypothetical protein
MVATHHAANPNTIHRPRRSATFLTNSAGTFIPVANLARLVSLPITFNNAVRRSLSGRRQRFTFWHGNPSFGHCRRRGARRCRRDNPVTTASSQFPPAWFINRVQTTPTN